MISILDNDLYKFSMSYAYMKLYPEAYGTFEFCDRNNTCYPEDFEDALREEFGKWENVRLTLEEAMWCAKNIPYIPKWYWQWLTSISLDPYRLYIRQDKEGHLTISITTNLYLATLYEVPILYTISELYHKMMGKQADVLEILDKTNKKASTKIKFSEFGTRRRFSFEVQDIVVSTLSRYKNCVGTSNVYFAKKYNMKPIGTVAHEWVMFHGAMYGYQEANYMAYKAWVDVYNGDLGTALTDTYTSDAFFRNFSMQHAKLFDGIRQDSGDEYEFINKAITRYKELGINPQSKYIVFSNALDFKKAKEIANYCSGKIGCSFGIGTNLTCDISYVKPMNIVMKLMSCRMNKNQPITSCVKISDDKGKEMGNSKEVEFAKYKLGL